jgi:hypothetical protein
MSDQPQRSTGSLSEPPDGPVRPGRPDWVPVDQRVGGFDRKTIWPGVVLLVVWVLWAHAIPWIDDRIAVDDQITAGELINLGSGEVTFEGAAGWQLDSGFRVVPGSEDKVSVPASASLSSDLVLYSAKSGNWDRSADELLDRMIDVDDALDQLVATDEQGRADITNEDGVPGRMVYVLGEDEAVLIAAFVFESADGSSSIAVEIEVRGAPNDIEDSAADIAAMIDTTTYRETGA